MTNNYQNAISRASQIPLNLLLTKSIYISLQIYKLAESRNKVYVDSQLPDGALILAEDGKVYEILCLLLDEEINKYIVTISSSASIKLFPNTGYSLDLVKNYLDLSTEVNSLFQDFLNGEYKDKLELLDFFITIVNKIINGLPIITNSLGKKEVDLSYATSMMSIKYYDPTKEDY